MMNGCYYSETQHVQASHYRCPHSDALESKIINYLYKFQPRRHHSESILYSEQPQESPMEPSVFESSSSQMCLLQPPAAPLALLDVGSLSTLKASSVPRGSLPEQLAHATTSYANGSLTDSTPSANSFSLQPPARDSLSPSHLTPAPMSRTVEKHISTFLNSPMSVKPGRSSGEGAALSDLNITQGLKPAPSSLQNLSPPAEPFPPALSAAPEQRGTLEHHGIGSLLQRLRASGFSPSEVSAAALSVPLHDINQMNATAVSEELKGGQPIPRITGWRSTVAPVATRSSNSAILPHLPSSLHHDDAVIDGVPFGHTLTKPRSVQQGSEGGSISHVALHSVAFGNDTPLDPVQSMYSPLESVSFIPGQPKSLGSIRQKVTSPVKSFPTSPPGRDGAAVIRSSLDPTRQQKPPSTKEALQSKSGKR